MTPAGPMGFTAFGGDVLITRSPIRKNHPVVIEGILENDEGVYCNAKEQCSTKNETSPLGRSSESTKWLRW